MAYHISVRTKGSNGEGPRELYQNPLGTGTVTWQYWLRPSGDLGLTFLCEHFDDGMEVSGHDLDHLQSDLNRLEQHWLDAQIGLLEQVCCSITHDDGSREEKGMLMQDYLRERLGFLREAIRIARESDAVVMIY